MKNPSPQIRILIILFENVIYLDLITKKPFLLETSQSLGVCTWFMFCFIFQDAFQAKCDILADNFHRFVHYLAIFVVHRDLCQWRQQYATRCVRLLKDIRWPTIFLPLYNLIQITNRKRNGHSKLLLSVYLPHRKEIVALALNRLFILSTARQNFVWLDRILT